MKQSSLIPIERIEKVIYVIRGEKVMLDRDLAKLYGVETKVLKQAVRRNIARFPKDFMFVLKLAELQNWRSQFVTSKADRKGLRHSPMAFTEHGILMLSSVLRSERAVQVNIEIMRAFVKLRQMLASNTELSRRLDELESKYDDLGYSGKWTYGFSPEGPNTRVTITEDGEVSNVIFRFLSRYAFGYTTSIDSYLIALGKQLGERVTPE